jgi:hypothetical protein
MEKTWSGCKGHLGLVRSPSIFTYIFTYVNFFYAVSFVVCVMEDENGSVSIGNLISLDSEIVAIEALAQLNKSTFVSRVSKFHLVNKSIEHLSHAYEITKNSSNVIKVQYILPSGIVKLKI